MSDKNKYQGNRPSSNNGRPKSKLPANSQPKRPNNIKENKKSEPATKRKTQSKKPKKSNNTFTKSIIILFTVSIIYSIGMLFSLANNTNVDSILLKSIDITKNDAYKGIIIRDEALYTASEDGYLSLIAKDLEKIKTGSLLFTVSKTTDTTLDSELNQVEDEIFNLQAFRSEYLNYRNDIDAIQSNIEKGIDTYSYNTYDDINSLNENIAELFDTRKQIVFADQQISDSTKIDTKDLIQGKIDENATKIYASKGGIVSYTFDGLENSITPDEMKNFSLDQTKMDSTYKSHDGISTVKDTPVLRVVQSNIWYVGVYIDKNDAKSLNVSDNRTLFININGVYKEVPARVKYISDKIDKSVYVIFEIRSYIEDFINYRSIDIALKTLTYKNIKIPKSAIVYKEYIKIPINYVRETDKMVVIKQLEDGTTATVPIIVESTNETENVYLIDKSKNDVLVGSILINPENAEEQYLVPELVTTPGVYKINNGTASFEKIVINEDIEKDTESEDYVYILPTNTLKEYDRILANSSNVTEGEIVY